MIVVSYNNGEVLERCLRSVIRSGGATEVILVDSDSADGSAEKVEVLFPDVRVIRAGHNGGFGYAGNLGAAAATSDYVAFLNPDVEVEGDWLRPLVAALEGDSQAGLATSRILLLQEPRRINSCGNDVHFTGITLCRGMGLGRDAMPERAEVGAVSGAAFVVRRDLFARLAGFDERFFMYMEDTDLSWRARLAGYRCIYVPDSVVYHDYTLRFGPRKTFYQERNRYLMLLKTLRWRTLLLLAPGLALAEVVTWGFVLVRERRNLANKLRAYAWIAGHWTEIMEMRGRVQPLRRVPDSQILSSCVHRLALEQTGDDLVARIAHLVMDPLFSASRRLARSAAAW